MKKLLLGLAVAGALVGAGCEADQTFGTAKGTAGHILKAAEAICGDNLDSGHQGITNIMLMEGSTDDGIVTCNDGFNSYFDG